MNRKLIAALAVTASVLATQAHATTVFESEAFSGGGRNDTTATAQSIGGLSTGGTITVYGSRMLALPGVDSADFYSFTLLGNGIVSFDVTTPTGWSYGNDPVLAVFSSTGARLGVDDDAGPGWDSFP